MLMLFVLSSRGSSIQSRMEYFFSAHKLQQGHEEAQI